MIILHKLVIKVGVEFFGDPEFTSQGFIAGFLSQSHYSCMKGTMIAKIPTALLSGGHHYVGRGAHIFSEPCRMSPAMNSRSDASRNSWAASMCS